MLDYTLLAYVLIAYFIFQLIRIQDIRRDAFNEGAAYGHTIGYKNGRDEIDEDMYEQGKESVLTKLGTACKSDTKG